MAFVAVNPHVLARELWPGDLGKLQQDAHLKIQNLPDSRVLPRGQAEFVEWLYIQFTERAQRAHVFVHPSVEGAEASPELVIRLQGVIEEMNLGLCGDWDQVEGNAKKAMQKLTLVAGGCREGFIPQLKALDDIRQTVSMMVGVSPRRVDMNGRIMLRRRVFTKVVSDTGPSVVKDREDPGGELEAMGDKWRITSRLKCGAQNATGGIDVLHPLFLRAGDMVDVSVTVVAVLSDGPGGKRCEVIFEPKTVVRMAEEETVKRVFEEVAEKARESRRRPTATRGPMQEGFSFGEKKSKVRKKEAVGGSDVGASGTAMPMDVVDGEASGSGDVEEQAEDGSPLIVGANAPSVFA